MQFLVFFAYLKDQLSLPLFWDSASYSKWYLLFKWKLLELWFVQDTEIRVEVCLWNLTFYPFHMSTFFVNNFMVNKKCNLQLESTVGNCDIAKSRIDLEQLKKLPYSEKTVLYIHQNFRCFAVLIHKYYELKVSV